MYYLMLLLAIVCETAGTTLLKFSDYPIVEQTRTGISAMEASDRPFVEMDDAEFIN